MKAYAGIGSRETPDDILAQMETTAGKLKMEGYTLRSGHAPGADQAFERGAAGEAEIYLPWPGFEQSVPVHANTIVERPSPEAFELAAKFHPAWERCGAGSRMLHARNSHQVLGANLDDPVWFVLCWTPGARVAGGTAQAIRIATDRRISVINLADPRIQQKLLGPVN